VQGLNVYQISGQSEPEHHSKNRHDIDEEAGGLEVPGGEPSFLMCTAVPLSLPKLEMDAPFASRYSFFVHETRIGCQVIQTNFRDMTRGDRERVSDNPFAALPRSFT
jgi:hypothetical protein